MKEIQFQGLLLQKAAESIYSQKIRIRAETAYLSCAYRGCQRNVPELLASVNIREMNLHEGYIHAGYGVPNSNACMCQCCWIRQGMAERQRRIAGKL